MHTPQWRNINVQFIWGKLLKDKAHDDNVLFSSSPEAKYFWISNTMFSLLDDALLRKKDDCPELELVVPKELQQKAIR